MKFGLFINFLALPRTTRRRGIKKRANMAYAEKLGFDTAWLAELHFNPLFSLIPAGM